MTKNTRLSPTAAAAIGDYCATLAEVCRRLKVDPIEALTNTDDYPAVCKAFMAEFSIGWLRGVADAAGVTVASLWAAHGPKTKTLAANRRKAA